MLNGTSQEAEEEEVDNRRRPAMQHGGTPSQTSPYPGTSRAYAENLRFYQNSHHAYETNVNEDANYEQDEREEDFDPVTYRQQPTQETSEEFVLDAVEPGEDSHEYTGFEFEDPDSGQFAETNEDGAFYEQEHGYSSPSPESPPHQPPQTYPYPRLMGGGKTFRVEEEKPKPAPAAKTPNPPPQTTAPSVPTTSTSAAVPRSSPGNASRAQGASAQAPQNKAGRVSLSKAPAPVVPQNAESKANGPQVAQSQAKSQRKDTSPQEAPSQAPPPRISQKKETAPQVPVSQVPQVAPSQRAPPRMSQKKEPVPQVPVSQVPQVAPSQGPPPRTSQKKETVPQAPVSQVTQVAPSQAPPPRVSQNRDKLPQKPVPRASQHSRRMPLLPPDVSDITEGSEPPSSYGARAQQVAAQPETSDTTDRQLSPLQREIMRQSLTGSKQIPRTSKKSRPSQRKYSRLIEDEWVETRGSRKSRSAGSVVLPVLNDNERRFHELVGAGDVPAVARFLADNPEVDINCINYQKTTALHVALKNADAEMVDFLLEQPTLNACDAVLIAVKVADISLLENVLSRLEETQPGLEFRACPNSAEFDDDVTPLMLAASEGKFEIVDMLLKRGHRIPDPHHPYCSCKACSDNLRRFDRLKFSSMKINLYKAVASPTYLFQTCADPIRRAFELTGELQAAAQMFPTFKAEYAELWAQLREFSHDLIGCCRNADEVEVILKQPAGCEAGGLLKFPRLQLAIDLNQKEFVAHTYTQAVLQSAWLGDEVGWKQQSVWQQALAPLWRIPMLFVLFCISCCGLRNVLVHSYSHPFNKFISAQASYLVFLALLFAFNMEDKSNQKRGPPTSFLIYPIMIYVLGYVWNTIRLFFILGYKRFFSYGWSGYDIATELLFLLTFIFWLASWADVSANGDENLPRKFWNAYDPILIAEGLFAIASILAFLKLYLPLSLNYHLGPLQISIGKMTKDLYQFVFVFSVMILAFTVGVCHFYQPYDGMVQLDTASNTTTSQVSSFVSFPLSLKTFFWAIFGQAPIESADVVISNLDESSTTNTHNFTEGVGYFVFAMYNFLATVVVLNMLVACMANTFTKVIDNVAVEWIFGRTKIYLLYMYHGVLPPPFNLIPTISDLTDALHWASNLGKGEADNVRAKFSLMHCCYYEKSADEKLERQFEELMSQLAQRYLVLKEEGGGGTETENGKSDLEEIKLMLRDLLAKPT